MSLGDGEENRDVSLLGVLLPALRWISCMGCVAVGSNSSQRAWKTHGFDA